MLQDNNRRQVGNQARKAQKNSEERLSLPLLYRITCNTPAIVVLVVMILFTIAELVLGRISSSASNVHLSLVVAQFFVFIIPCSFFALFNGIATEKGLLQFNFRLFPLRKVGFVLSCLPVLVFGTMLIKYIGYLLFGHVNNSVVVSSHTDYMLLVLSSAVVPAFCEELLLRGVVFTEYEKKVGAFGAICASSVMFALLHFDFRNFAAYLFAGIILGISLHVTRSLLAPIILHFLNNFICIYADTFLGRISKESISTVFVIFMFVVVLLVSLFVFFECLEWLCIDKRKKISEEKRTASTSNMRLLIPGETVASSLVRVFAAPVFWIVLLFFILKTILA